jgi:hypothetical protein
VVTHGLNLPRHGVATAFVCDIAGIGFTQSGMPAKAAGRSIKRMVQPRKLTPDGYSWESPDAGQTCFSDRIHADLLRLWRRPECAGKQRA